ncbi:MAG: ROK family protein [Microvirga sp.]
MLELIRTTGSVSRAEVARRSGLSKPTVSQALTGLLGSRLVREVGRESGRKGPGAVLYELNPESGWVVGLDVGRQWVRVALADITGRIIARRDERTRARSAATLVAQIGRIGHDVAADAGLRWSQVTHATVGNPGVLDPSRGQLSLAPNLPGWGKPGLVEAIRAELGTRTSFENDVNLAALGERALGAGRGVSDFCFLWIGTGVGLGIVIGGELHRGAAGAAGEIGYLPLGAGDPHDPAVRRRGLLEESASGAAVVRAARDAGVQVRTPKAVFAAARRGEPAALRAVDVEAARIALAIAAVAPVLDPELVILGGGIARGGGDLLLEPVARELAALSPFRPRLAITELGDEAVLHGAVSVALGAAQEEMFDRTRDLERREIVA